MSLNFKPGETAMDDADGAMLELKKELEAIKLQRDELLEMLAEWCAAVSVNGGSWDDWDGCYKGAMYGHLDSEGLRELLDNRIEAHEEDCRIQSSHRNRP